MHNLLSLVYICGMLSTLKCHLSRTFLYYPPCRPCHCYVDHTVKIANCSGRHLSTLPRNIPRDTEVLHLEGNAFSRLRRKQFVNLPNLTTLELSRNKISTIEDNTFSGLDKLLVLSLESNRLTKLNNDTFSDLHTLQVLNLSHCNVKKIDLNTFTPMKNLQILDFSDNPGLGLKGLENAAFGLQNSTIKKLYINKIISDHAVCVVISNSIARLLQKTPLEEIQADTNRIEIFADRALSLLPKTLKRLYLRQNRFTTGSYLKHMSSLENLEEVDVSGKHGSHDLPVFEDIRSTMDEVDECDNHENCASTKIQENLQLHHFGVRELTHSNSLKPVTYHVPPKLKNLTCTYSQMTYHITEVIISNNSFERINLSSNLLSTWIGPVYGLENLTYLDLSNNVARNISRVFFKNFTNLQYLNVSYNFLGLMLSKDRKGKIFGNLKNLLLLDLSNNFILSLRDDVFQGLTSLQVMDLSNNSMHSFFFNIEYLKNLKTLRCTANQIRWIPKHLTRQLDKLAESHNVTLDLSENPITCGCDNLPFLWWLLNSDVQFGNFSNYFCIYNNEYKRRFDDLDDIYEDLYYSCYKHFEIALGAVALFMFILCFILSAVAYRYRWKLRYWYYAARLRYSRPSESCAEGDFQFDAFVSFADEDRDFVTDHLLPKLEDEAGLRLNFHQRDFTPGRPIAQNIVNAVQISKRTLIILSEDFLASNWCKYELEMANMEKVTSERDVILIIMYRSVESKDIPAEIAYHIKNDSFIEYPSQGERDVFWRSLTEALKS